MKLKKRRKSSRMHGRGMGSHGWGSRKKHVGTSGHSGGKGMSGTGKMAGQKKTLVLKLYGTKYFGKQGITSKGTERKKNLVMNVGYLETYIESLKKKFEKNGIIDLSDYKILGDGEIKTKINIKAKSASKSAVEKIEKAGGKVMLPIREEKTEIKQEKKEEKE
jgi:large subunit ribosomal protein L15